MDERSRLADRRQTLGLRAKLLQSLRSFFTSRDYLEVETPSLLPSLAPEPHIQPIRTASLYLHTSPELCMKRLMAAGYSRIFQICKCFRAHERGDLHLPEFSLLEWYRQGTDYRGLMEECESMIRWVAQSLGLEEALHYQGRAFELTLPWDKVSVEQAFERYASLSLQEAMARDAYEEVLVHEVEPHLGFPRPLFLYDYPRSMAALARLNRENPGVAERFELYIAGMEIANGFSELTDPREQEARFQEALNHQAFAEREPMPMPEKFLTALRFMPEAAGIALGVDRLVMIFGNRTQIDDVVSFTPEEL